MNIENFLLKSATELTLVLLLLGVVLAFIRLLIGPDPADRIVALDLISILIVAFLAAYSIYRDEKSFLDVAIAYALIAFLGTVALARYRERLAKKHGHFKTNKDIDNE
jgi:multicomponent Na+:H+ antiporter subunit F